jgi:hypothetical protein
MTNYYFLTKFLQLQTPIMLKLSYIISKFGTAAIIEIVNLQTHFLYRICLYCHKYGGGFTHDKNNGF